MKLISIFLQYLLFWRKNEKKEFLGVACFDNKIFILATVSKSHVSRLHFFVSKGSAGFRKLPRTVEIKKSSGAPEDLTNTSDYRFATVNGKHFLTFVSSTKRGKKTGITATSDDMFNWTVVGRSTTETSPAVIIDGYEQDGQFAKVFGEGDIHVSLSKNAKKWDVKDASIIMSRNGFKFDGSRYFDSSANTTISVLGSGAQKRGIYTLYNASFETDSEFVLRVGFVLLANDNPGYVLQRGEMPLWEQSISKKQYSSLTIIGACVKKGKTYLYFVADGELMDVVLPDPYEYMDRPHRGALKLRKAMQNPVIVPNDCNNWEMVATFNPTATYIDDKVHLLYRAMGHDGLSFMGYGGSMNGIDFHERLDDPAYYPREPFEGVNSNPSSFSDLYMSGGGWGGCEDARMTRINDYVFVTYVAYNGYHAPRIAMSHIALQDFLDKNWKKWSKPQLLSKADFVTKGPCLFPEKVNGKYVICHRVFPDILIDYVDNLDFSDDEKWLEGHERIKVNGPRWDSRKIGVGGAPILTKKGWLLIYYGVDDRDPARYMIGAMLLDKDNPHKVKARTRKPIIMPEEWYENNGHKSGVAYPCGYIIKNGMLYVYYGGADTVTCVATAPVDSFLNALAREKVEPFELEKVIVI